MNGIKYIGADSSWYPPKKKEPIRKYHKYFRQRDTLLNIPKQLEEVVRRDDEEAYNKVLEEASELRTNIKTEIIVKTITETAAIVNE